MKSVKIPMLNKAFKSIQLIYHEFAKLFSHLTFYHLRYVVEDAVSVSLNMSCKD